MFGADPNRSVRVHHQAMKRAVIGKVHRNQFPASLRCLVRRLDERQKRRVRAGEHAAVRVLTDGSGFGSKLAPGSVGYDSFADCFDDHIAVTKPKAPLAVGEGANGKRGWDMRNNQFKLQILNKLAWWDNSAIKTSIGCAPKTAIRVEQGIVDSICRRLVGQFKAEKLPMGDLVCLIWFGTGWRRPVNKARHSTAVGRDPDSSLAVLHQRVDERMA